MARVQWQGARAFKHCSVVRVAANASRTMISHEVDACDTCLFAHTHDKPLVPLALPEAVTNPGPTEYLPQSSSLLINNALHSRCST